MVYLDIMNMKRKSVYQRHNRTRGWGRMAPSSHERTLQLSRCGHKKCFLGPDKSFPICNAKTCTRSRKGIESAYIRAKQFHHTKIAKKAHNLLKQYSHRRRFKTRKH